MRNPRGAAGVRHLLGRYGHLRGEWEHLGSGRRRLVRMSIFAVVGVVSGVDGLVSEVDGLFSEVIHLGDEWDHS